MTSITEWLSAQKKLLEAATPGPWEEHKIDNNYCGGESVLCNKDTIIFDTSETFHINHECKMKWGPQENIDFIASVRTEHERALKLIEKYREALEILERDTNLHAIAHCVAANALFYFPEVE